MFLYFWDISRCSSRAWLGKFSSIISSRALTAIPTSSIKDKISKDANSVNGFNTYSEMFIDPRLHAPSFGRGCSPHGLHVSIW